MNINLYDKEVYDQILSRIEKLNIASTPQWGEMDVAQMMAHCSEVIDVYNGVNSLKHNFITRLFKGYIRKIVVGPSAYKKNSPTAPQFKITSHKDYNTEKERLLKVIEVFYKMEKNKAENIDHSLFGKMNLDERGWAMYKHLNHHLKQFGV